MPATSVKSSWSSGSLVFHEDASYAPSTTYDLLTLGTTAVKVGNTANDVDFQYYGTGSLSWIIDCGAATLTNTGIAVVQKSALTIGISGTGHDVTFYGDTAGCDFLWDQNGDTDGSLTLGADTKGVDFKVFGATTGNYLLWDKSGDKLSVVQSNAATTGVETSFSNAMTMTGAGASAEAAVASITINAAAGTYTNALCARTTYGASGKTTGYSGVICAEMNTSAGCTDGTYVLFEAEAIFAANAVTGTAYAVMGVNASGAQVANFDSNAYLFDIQGVTSNSGKFWYANKSVPFDAYLRIRVGNTPYYIGVLAQQAAAS